MLIEKSNRKGKRFQATFANGKIVHFGQAGGQTYIDHGDEAKRAAYLARHEKRENWNNPYSAGALSRWILWGPTTSFDKNHDLFMKKYPVTYQK